MAEDLCKCVLLEINIINKLVVDLIKQNKMWTRWEKGVKERCGNDKLRRWDGE